MLAVTQDSVYKIISLGEAQDLAMPIALGDTDHVEQIILARNVAADVEPKVPVKHYGCLYFTPERLRIALEHLEVMLIGVSYGRSQTLQLSCVALLFAFAVTTGLNGRQADGRDCSHLGIARADLNIGIDSHDVYTPYLLLVDYFMECCGCGIVPRHAVVFLLAFEVCHTVHGVNRNIADMVVEQIVFDLDSIFDIFNIVFVLDGFENLLFTDFFNVTGEISH